MGILVKSNLVLAMTLFSLSVDANAYANFQSINDSNTFEQASQSRISSEFSNFSKTAKLAMSDQPSFSDMTQKSAAVSHYKVNEKGTVVPSSVNSTQDEVVSSVPETQSYAMMLSGLGLIVFAARRRSRM